MLSRKVCKKLSKKACKRCREMYDPWYISHGEAFENNWINRQVWCRMETDNGSNGWKDIRTLPTDGCPFVLEHLVSSQTVKGE